MFYPLALYRCMSIDNSEIDIIPCRQGFIGISTIQDFSERGPVQVIEKGGMGVGWGSGGWVLLEVESVV